MGSTNSWGYIACMLYWHENFAATSSGDFLYMAGGWNSNAERYNPLTSAWEALPNNPYNAGGHGTVFLIGYWWVLGGTTSCCSTYTASMGRLEEETAITGTWQQKTSMPTNRGYGMRAVAA